MADEKNPENMLVMETSKGKVVIELMPDLAPGHVARIKELAREGAYDGVVFHRVIKALWRKPATLKTAIKPMPALTSAVQAPAVLLSLTSRLSFQTSIMAVALVQWPVRKTQILPIRSFSFALAILVF